MTEKRDNHQKQPKKLPDAYTKVDRRYRDSKNFLIDQLRHADSVEDFRTVKHAILRSTQFSIAKRTFNFARVPIPVRRK